MVTATCEKCGALHRFEDADVPPSGKVMKCSVCGHSMTVMHATAAEMGFPTPPRTVAPTPAVKPPAVKPPAPPVKPPAPAIKPGIPTIKPPAPPVKAGIPPIRPPAAPAQAAAPAAPAAPEPRVGSSPALAAFDRSGELDVDDGIELGSPGLGDLPAPKRPSPLAGIDAPAGKPAPRSALSAASPASDFFDLELPSGPTGGEELLDLPAPVGPRPTRGAAIPDLPAPVGPRPSRSAAGADAIPDLPAPVGPRPSRTATGGADAVPDLPAPVGPRPSRSATGAGAVPDLPAPVGPASQRDLPAPVGPTPSKSIDLPAPKGFFDDIPPPGPAAAGGGGGDLPAPKGFFDDLPAPTSGGRDLPAPKGFFDDIPAPARGGGTELPAPRGFFDDVPAVPPLGRPPAPAAGLAHGGPAPLDLDDLDLAPPASPLATPPAAVAAAVGAPAGLDDAPMLDLDGLELSAPVSGHGGDRLGGDRFGEVDLPDAPGAPGVVTFSRPTGAAPAEPARRPERRADEGKIEVDDSVRKETVAKVTKGMTATKQAREAEQDKRRLGFGRKPLLIAGAVVLVGALGAGGWYLWNQRQESQQRSSEVADILTAVRANLVSDKPGHWDRALVEAERALAVDGDSADALGLAAQAAYAGWLDEGTRVKERKDKGRLFIGRINSAAASGHEIDKAEALRAIVEGNPKQAATDLEALTRARPADPDTWLYLGWAWAEAHDPRKALAAFTTALQRSKDRLPALYGKAQALLALGNTKEAAEAFTATRKRDEQYRKLDGYVEHLGALVGSYQLGEVQRFSERENRYLEITTHPQKDQADPRAIATAWSLAGDQALTAGRGDEARRRYDQALALDPRSARARVGIARVDLAQGRLDDARIKLEQVLAADAGNLDATLALAETLVALGQVDEAQKRVRMLLDRKPPIDSKYQLARAHLVQGAIHDRAPEGRDLAIAEYQKAHELIGPEEDIRPTVALARALAAHPDPAHRDKGVALLRPIEQRAADDPAIAISLGLAYAAAGRHDEAAAAFRSALARRPNDVEALFQLGLTLHRQKRHDEAIASMTRAFGEGGREDVGLQLALVYEDLGRDREAGEVYRTLLSVSRPTINVRVRAGRYFARMQSFTEVGGLAKAILDESPQHPAGLFLRAESLASTGKYADAVKDYTDAVNQEPEPQYFDGLGRALERQDPPETEQALKAYKAASADADYLSPRLGIVCVRLMDRTYKADAGKVLDAIADARRLAPTDPWLDFAIAFVQHESRQYDQAAATYAQALRSGKVAPLPRAYMEYRRGLALGQMERGSEAARALTTATRAWEDLLRKGGDAGDWPRCPLRAITRDAAPAQHSKSDEPLWVREAYRELGYRERDRNNRRAAIDAWERYLQRVTSPDDAEAKEVRRLLLRLQAN